MADSFIEATDIALFTSLQESFKNTIMNDRVAVDTTSRITELTPPIVTMSPGMYSIPPEMNPDSFGADRFYQDGNVYIKGDTLDIRLDYTLIGYCTQVKDFQWFNEFSAFKFSKLFTLTVEYKNTPHILGFKLIYAEELQSDVKDIYASEFQLYTHIQQSRENILLGTPAERINIIK